MTLQTLLILIPGVMLIALIFFVAVPFVRLEMRRRQSRKVAPSPEQIWIQDGDLIYIDFVDSTGVGIISSLGNGNVVKWKDSWPQWRQRLQDRVLWYTGQSRPLGGG